MLPFLSRSYTFLANFISNPQNIDLADIDEEFVIIHGHFLANHFDSLLEHLIRTVVFRDPLKRVYSQYIHWIRTRGANNWRVQIPYNPKFSFEDYALLSELNNYQYQSLGGIPLQDFSLVGITEDLKTFTQRLVDSLLDKGLVSCSRDIRLNELNRGVYNVDPYESCSSSFIANFVKKNDLDYSLYNLVKESLIV